MNVQRQSWDVRFWETFFAVVGNETVQNAFCWFCYVVCTSQIVIYGASAITWANAHDWFRLFFTGMLILLFVLGQIQVVRSLINRNAKVVSASQLPLFAPTKEAWINYPAGDYVYVIQDVEVSRYCKIGRTNNLQRRLGTFEVALPFRFVVVCILQRPNSKATEALLHTQFAGKRINGEWFALDASDMHTIQNLKSLLHPANSNGHSEGAQS